MAELPLEDARRGSAGADPPHEGTAAREWRVLLNGCQRLLDELGLRASTVSVFRWHIDHADAADTIEVSRKTVARATHISVKSLATVSDAWKELEARGYVELGVGTRNRRTVRLVGPGKGERALAAKLRPAEPPLFAAREAPSLPQRAVASSRHGPTAWLRAVAWGRRLATAWLRAVVWRRRLASDPSSGDDGSPLTRRLETTAVAESHTDPSSGDDGSHGNHERERSLSPMSPGTMDPCHGEPVPLGAAVVGALDRVAKAQPAKIEAETQRLARELTRLGERIGRAPGTMHPVLLQRTVRAVADGKLAPKVLDEALLHTRTAAEAGDLREGSPGKYFVGCLQRRGFDPTRRE